jgi:hypothetical protein
MAGLYVVKRQGRGEIGESAPLGRQQVGKGYQGRQTHSLHGNRPEGQNEPESRSRLLWLSGNIPECPDIQLRGSSPGERVQVKSQCQGS